jgi:hypothetical protein
MKEKGKNVTQRVLESDPKPLIALFELLLEWDMKDVQEEAEKRKEISKKI